MSTNKSMFVEDKNVGLMSSFNIVNGKFELTGGVVKCQDNVRMLIAFGGWFRLMKPDFCVNLFWLIGKPTSWVATFKTVILGRFSIAAQKYATFIKIQKANVFSNPANRKEITIGIEYTYTLDQTSIPNQYIQTLI